MSKPTRFERSVGPAIESWCKLNKVDPTCVSLFARAPKSKPGGVTYRKIEIKELTEFLDHYSLTPYQRSKPVKEPKK